MKPPSKRTQLAIDLVSQASERLEVAPGVVPPAETPRPSPRPVRVIDGQAFEVVDYEKLLNDRDWPRGGSSLSGYEMGLSVRR